MNAADITLPHEEDAEQLAEDARTCTRRATSARLRTFKLSEDLPISEADRAEIDRQERIAAGEDHCEGQLLIRLNRHFLATGSKGGERRTVAGHVYRVNRWRDCPAVYLGAELPDDDDDVESDREALAERRSGYHAATYPG